LVHVTCNSSSDSLNSCSLPELSEKGILPVDDSKSLSSSFVLSLNIQFFSPVFSKYFHFKHTSGLGFENHLAASSSSRNTDTA
jgi:hypothetical protein